MTINLSHGDTVRHANWIGDTTARVGTARSYARINGRDPEEAHAAAIERHQDTVWTIYVGGTIMADGPAKDAHYAAKAEQRARAVTIDNGDTVSIEGELFTVKFNRGNTGNFPTNCDPIRFVPVKQQITASLDALGAEMDKHLAELDAADEADDAAESMFGKEGAA